MSAMLCAWICAGLSLTQGAAAQTCASPLPATVGVTNNVSVAPNSAPQLSLVNICDASRTSSDVIHNPRWYRFVPTSSGRYAASTCGLINFDSKMAVATSCSVIDPTTVLGCNDDGASPCNTTSGSPFASRVEFDAVAGTPYFIAIGGHFSSTSGTGGLRIEPAPPASGCATAPVAITGNNAFDSSSSNESLDLTGFCNPGPSGDDVMRKVVWFRWTAPQTTVVEVSTCGTANFDTRLAVLLACGDPSSVITCADDSAGCDLTTKVRFEALQGRQYRIAVGGFDAASAGPGILKITINVDESSECGVSPNDCCLASPDGRSHCSNLACCELVCSVDPFCCAGAGEGAWDEACAEFARLACTSCGGGTCELQQDAIPEPGQCDTAVDLNAGCASGVPGPVMTIAPGEVRAGRLWAADGTRDTDWYEFVVTEQQMCNFTLRSSGPAQVFIVDDACPDYSVLSSTLVGAFPCPLTTARCLVPGRYRAVVSLSVFDGFPSPCTEADARVRYTLEMGVEGCDAVPPPNDECTTSMAVPAAGAILPFDTRLSTDTQASLGTICDKGNGTNFVRDLWYAWRPAAGLVRVTTCGSADFDTRIAVYEECQLLPPPNSDTDPPSVSPIECNDDAIQCPGLTSEIDFFADGSTTYFVRIGGYEGTGRGLVRFVPLVVPPNDGCPSARTVQDGTYFFSTALATSSAPALPASCDEGLGSDIVNDVWFRYVAPYGGTVTFSTCGPLAFDSRMAVYASCGSPLPLECNDDAPDCGLLGSRISMPVTTGQVLLVRVGGLDTAGEGEFTVRTVCTGDLNSDGVVNGLDLGLMLGAWSEPGPTDLNGDGVTNGLDLGLMLGNWGLCL